MRLPPPFRQQGEHIAIELNGGHAVFTPRRGGVSDGPFASLNLGLTVPGDQGRPTPGDAAASVAENRAVVARDVGVPAEHFAHGHQVHGSDVVRVTTVPQGAWPAARIGNVSAADGQATALRDVATVVLAADCLPLALVAPGAVAMVHAGWRGLAAGVVQEGIAAIRELAGAGPVAMAIGPGAGRCCYEVGDEVLAAFARYGPDVRDGRHIDLKAVATRIALDARASEVHDVGYCTICSDPGLFFSHRRDGGTTGRQAGIAWRS